MEEVTEFSVFFGGGGQKKTAPHRLGGQRVVYIAGPLSLGKWKP
jgi:hypothetical protein